MELRIVDSIRMLTERNMRLQEPPAAARSLNLEGLVAVTSSMGRVMGTGRIGKRLQMAASPKKEDLCCIELG